MCVYLVILLIIGPGADNLEQRDGEEGEDDDDDIDEEVDVVIDRLLLGLSDKETVIRWTSAKGLARVCYRLPLDFADQVKLNCVQEEGYNDEVA